MKGFVEVPKYPMTQVPKEVPSSKPPSSREAPNAKLQNRSTGLRLSVRKKVFLIEEYTGISGNTQEW
jgi:hypothetical protein